MTEHVFILGAGRAGRGLARALRAAGIDVVGIHGRRADAGADGVTAGPLPPALGRADVAMVAVRDGQLDGALAELSAGGLRPGAIVLHLSGSAEPRGFVTLRAAGHPCGTFHPLVPLADPARAPALFHGAWVGIDGDVEAVAWSRSLAARLGARALAIPPGAKGKYHAAAVFASNFPIVLAAIASRLLSDIGVDAEDGAGEGRAAVLGLMSAALANLEALPPEAALTGPVVRGDVDTVRRHLEALAGDREARAAYVALARAALALAQHRGADERSLREMDALLS